MNSEKFEILAGDFPLGEVDFSLGFFRISRNGLPGIGERMDFSDVISLDVASEETFKKTAGKIGWGIAGAMALGAVGAVAGVVLGGKKTTLITFILVFDDGRKILGKADEKTFTVLRSKTFK